MESKKEESTKVERNHASALAHTFLYLMASQVISRGLSFFLNLLIARKLTAEDFGVYSVQFHLLVTGFLFISREGFQRGCLRDDVRVGGNLSQNVTKLLSGAWLTVPIGAITSIATCVFIFWWQNLKLSEPYGKALVLHGSLVVRTVFQPFEESAFTIFAKAASGTSSRRISVLEDTLGLAMKLVIMIGFFFVTFGPSYSYILVRLLYGKSWSDGEASVALGYYCLYVMLLAINGTSEAFLHAAGSNQQLL